MLAGSTASWSVMQLLGSSGAASGSSYESARNLVVVHFGMTGSLELAGRGDVRRRSDRIGILCGGEEVRYRDVRKLGGLWVARDAAELATIIGVPGPDASVVSLAELTDTLARRRGAIKPLLMDQRVVAGLGNMMSDEILWNAGIDPARRANTLSGADVRRLGNSVRDLTRRAVKAGPIPARDRGCRASAATPSRVSRVSGPDRASHDRWSHLAVVS